MNFILNLNPEQSLFFFPLFSLAIAFLVGSRKLHLTGSPSLQMWKLGSKSINTRCSIPVSPIRLFPSPFQVLSKSSSLCMKSIPGVWRICAPVGIVVQTHAGVYDALGLQKWLLNQSPPHVLLFQFVCAPKHLSHTFSAGTALWLYNKKPVPRKFLHTLRDLLIYYWTPSDNSVQLQSKKVVFNHLLLLWLFTSWYSLCKTQFK